MDWLGLLGAAFLLGLTGGVHCLAMCTGLQHAAMQPAMRSVRRPGPQRNSPSASACVIPIRPLAADRLVRAEAHDNRTPDRLLPANDPGRSPIQHLLGFHAARIMGYAALGAMVAAASSGLRWGAEWAAPLRTVWILLNAAVLSLGLSLAIRGAMPRWIDAWTHRLWQSVQARRLAGPRHSVALVGLAWVFLPCGLLGSALALALLASDAARGASIMASFGAGTAIDLMIVQSLWFGARHEFARRHPDWQRAGVRLSGALLGIMAAMALWTIARGQAHPFCGA